MERELMSKSQKISVVDIKQVKSTDIQEKLTISQTKKVIGGRWVPECGCGSGQIWVY
jgi:hypothetical protein